MNRIIRNGSNKNKAALIATGILVLAGWIRRRWREPETGSS